MATFSDYIKNIFWVLLLLQFAPVLIEGIKKQYSDFLEPKTKVGVIPIKEKLFESTKLVEQIRKLFTDNSIKAIVLNIDCPGGASGTSQTIFNEINHYKKEYPHKYVVSFVENMAASGGYYVACATNYIIASPSATIGSIGSALTHPNFKDFIESYKIKYELIKAGAYKGAGSPFLSLTPEQKALLQNMADNIYKQFIKDVASKRPLLPADSTVWADGKVFSGEQALALKLIDELGSQSTVRKVLKEKAHIEGPIEFVKPPKTGGFWSNLFSQDGEDDAGSFMQNCVQSVCNVLEQRYMLRSEV